MVFARGYPPHLRLLGLLGRGLLPKLFWSYGNYYACNTVASADLWLHKHVTYLTLGVAAVRT